MIRHPVDREIREAGRTSIRQRLVLSYLLMTLILLATGIGLYFSIMNQEARRKYLDSVHYNLKQLAYIMEDQIGAVNLYADMMARNTDILYLTMTDRVKDKDIVDKTMYAIVPLMTEVIAQNSNIRGIRIIHGNPSLFNIYDMLFYDPCISNGQWESRLRTLCQDGLYQRNGLFIEYSQDGNIYSLYGRSTVDSDVWYVYRSIYSSTLTSLRSMIEVRLPNQSLCTPIAEYPCNEGEFVMLANEAGSVIFGVNELAGPLVQNGSLQQSEGPVVNLSGTKYYTVSKHVEQMNSYLVQYVPVRNASMSNMTLIIYTGVVLLLGLGFYFISRFTARVILAKLLLLSDAMNSICHGQMETRVDIQSKDEIGQMADNFNNMLDRLKTAQATEQKMIYRHLSDQISPHFLCNALDMVCMSAKLRQQTDISDAIELISRYFRTNLSAAGGTVSIGEEFAYIRDYIEITNLIRDIPVTYDLDIEEDLASFQIPRFIIQPFVENALRHGFRSKLRNCHIDLLAARRAPDQVILTIEDNGSGMSDERLAYVRSQMTSDEEESLEIGITNSIRRMRIYFGERFDCTFESYPEVGTRVLLTILL